MINRISIKDMKRICRMACAKQGASRALPKDIYIVHSKGAPAQASIYFSNSIFAGRLQVPDSALSGIRCDCAFMPSDFLKSCDVSDQCTPEYLRDIHTISISECLNRRWHLRYEELKHVNTRLMGLSMSFSTHVLSDLFRFAKQMGFDNACIDISDMRPAMIEALDVGCSLELIVMPMIR